MPSVSVSTAGLTSRNSPPPSDVRDLIAGHLSFPKHYVSGKRYLAYQHESAYLLAKESPSPPSWALADVIEWNEFPANELHARQKPLSVLKPLIEAFSEPGQLILDPFTGSGSTLLAAKQLGRSYIGIELDRNYHALATHRLLDSSF
jgi:adenine-specific DNA-methyltransferase